MLVWYESHGHCNSSKAMCRGAMAEGLPQAFEGMYGSFASQDIERG